MRLGAAEAWKPSSSWYDCKKYTYLQACIQNGTAGGGESFGHSLCALGAFHVLKSRADVEVKRMAEGQEAGCGPPHLLCISHTRLLSQVACCGQAE